MKKGRVYWITGLPNSGKTTVGNALYYDLRSKNDNVVILDGDIMKDITTERTSDEYSWEGRLIRARRYSLLGKLLSDQGLVTIICTISMFDEIREWNRANIKGYIEVFLDVSDEVLRKRDRQGLFDRIQGKMELPKNPDITIRNDGVIPIRTIIDDIKKINPVEEDYDRDRLYWNNYYSEARNISGLNAPSAFAEFIGDKLVPGRHLLELGCGNGRDSLYFLAKGLRVTGIDASDTAIEFLKNITRTNDNAMFVCDNFVKCRSMYQLKYDYIYSRFTLHAITEEQEDELLYSARQALVEGGVLFIEARTIHDELYRKGRQVGRNSYIYDGHFRRFIDKNEFLLKLKKMGYDTKQAVEGRGFSKMKDSDPVLLRIIATV